MKPSNVEPMIPRISSCCSIEGMVEDLTQGYNSDMAGSEVVREALLVSELLRVVGVSRE